MYYVAAEFRTGANHGKPVIEVIGEKLISYLFVVVVPGDKNFPDGVATAPSQRQVPAACTVSVYRLYRLIHRIDG